MRAIIVLRKAIAAVSRRGDRLVGNTEVGELMADSTDGLPVIHRKSVFEASVSRLSITWCSHVRERGAGCGARIALGVYFGVDFRERLLWGKQRAVDCEVPGGDVLVADVLVSNCFCRASSLQSYRSGQMYRLRGGPFCGS